MKLDEINHTQVVKDIIAHAKLTERHEKILKQQAATAGELITKNNTSNATPTKKGEIL